MEEPLIAQESNFVRVEGSDSVEVGEGSGSRFSYLRQKLLPSRSEAITSGSKYQRAAALVDLAEDGVGLPEEVLDDPRFENAAKYYFIYCNFELLWSLNLFAMLVLNFLEKPLWCARSVHSCQDRVFYFLGELPYLTNGESVVYEGITFFILIVHTLFPISYEGFHLYWRNRLNILKVVLLALLLCDIILFNAFSISSLPVEQLPMRIAPYLRVLFLALSIREIRACLVTLGGMLGMYLNVLALSLMFLLFSSWLAYVTFEDTQQGIMFFTSYGTTLYEMFLLFTTSNNPDVWIPAYKSSRWSCIFFILYVLLGVYFVTNLILAVVYDSFKAELARQVFEMDSMRLRILQKAFSVIDNFNRQFLDKDQCICLFKEMNHYRSLPKTSIEDFELIFSELDDSGDFKINVDEFADLCNAIASKFEKEPSKSMFENYPTFYHSGSCKMLKDFVISPLFGYIVAFVLVLNFVAVVIETTLDIQNNSGQIFWQRVEFSFGWLYVLEIALKIFSIGFDKYWMEGQNQFDFVVTWVIVLGETATLFIPDGFTLLANGEWIRYLLIARMLRLIRILMHVPRYRGFISTFFKLIPALMPYLGTIFFVMCIYCSLGLQLFGGLVYSGNPDLEATELYDNDYLLFNFNDYPNGMVTLFNILVLASGQEWMQTYKKLTGTSWSLVYFVSFYLIAIMLLLNLVLAFVLEAFFAEMDLNVADDGEGSSSQRKGRKMIGLARSRKVDALLHQVLSNELKESQSMRP